MWRQRVGVDHRRDRVGGVVEAVDELEAQGDQQRYAQQQEWRPGGELGAHFVHVVHQAVGGEQQAHGEYGEEHDHRQQAGFCV